MISPVPWLHQICLPIVPCLILQILHLSWAYCTPTQTPPSATTHNGCQERIQTAKGNQWAAQLTASRRARNRNTEYVAFMQTSVSTKETGYIHGFQGYTEKLTEHVTLFISQCGARKNQKAMYTKQKVTKLWRQPHKSTCSSTSWLDACNLMDPLVSNQHVTV